MDFNKSLMHSCGTILVSIELKNNKFTSFMARVPNSILNIGSFKFSTNLSTHNQSDLTTLNIWTAGIKDNIFEITFADDTQPIIKRTELKLTNTNT